MEDLIQKYGPRANIFMDEEFYTACCVIEMKEIETKQGVKGKNESQRAMMAAELIKHYKKFESTIKLIQKKWIANARRSLPALERQPCEVCGRFKHFAHAHHVTPLSVQFKHGLIEPDHTIAWVCPNHHLMVHAIISAANSENGDRFEEIADIQDGNEVARLVNIVDRARWI